MGSHRNITAIVFPAQGDLLGRAAEVCFHYDTSQTLEGVIVRDDAEEPWQTIIRLADGRHVLSTECQYSPVPDPRALDRLTPEDRTVVETDAEKIADAVKEVSAGGSLPAILVVDPAK